MAKSVLHDQPLQLGRVLDQLVADGLLDAERGNTLKAVAPAMARQQHPLITIAQHKWPDARAPQRVLDLPLLTEWLAGKSGLDSARIDPLKVDVPAITAVMSYAYARRFNILALEVRPDEVVVATAEPAVREWERELTRILGKRIVRVLVDPEQISRYLIEFYTLSHSVRAASDDNRQGERSGVQNLEQLMELGRAGKLEADDQHIVSIVDWLLQYAYAQRASDIHIEPRREQTNIRFRIDGVMHMVYQIPVSVATAVTSRIKILGRMDVSEKRRPQDGRLKTRSAQGNEVELRLSTMPTAFGEKLVMRIFDPDVLVKDYQALGFSSSETQLWTRLINEPTGIILVTGPTGSGKTTTLYSTLKQLATEEVNVCSVEDPIEMVEPAFNQMQVQQNIDLTFSDGIRTLLRQDPDIIMVGEIRDGETAEMATQAALTGHLVLSTLHTNDAPSSITRLLDLDVPFYLINSTVIGIMAQRLVRTLCPHCKEATDIDQATWDALVSPWKIAKPNQIQKAVGCLECRMTGYRGRSGIYEMLTISPAIKKLIAQNADLAAIRATAHREGMVPLMINGAEKVAAGITTIEELLKVAPSPLD